MHDFKVLARNDRSNETTGDAQVKTKMKPSQSVRRIFACTPAPLAAAAGLALFIAAGLLAAAFMQPPRDVRAECSIQCKPRFSRVVADKSYPMSAKGTYRQVCECY